MKSSPVASEEVLRTRIGRAIAWLSGAMVVLIFMTTALLVWVTEPGIRAERERTFKQQSILVTENLASALHIPDSGEHPQLEQNVFLAPMAAEFSELLRQHRGLVSLTAVGEDLSVVRHAAESPREVASIVAALKTLPSGKFPPKNDEVSVLAQGNRLFTAGRIADGPGVGGPLLLLEFEANSQFSPLRLMSLVVAFTVLTALLIWGALHHALTRLVARPILALTHFRSRLSSGDWSDRIQPSGSSEVRQFQDLTNKSVDRAHRLSETIQWRADYLERFDPSKRAEVRHIVEEATGSYRFGSPSVSSSQPVHVAGMTYVGLALIIELIALFSILGEPGWRTVAVASLSAPLPAVVLVVTGVGYVLGQSLATRALRRVGFKSLAIIVQFTSALSFAAGALMAANDVVLIGSRAVAAISAATLVSAWWHARNAAAEQANSPKGLLIPGNPLAMVLPFAPIATTFAAASSFAPTFAALALVALIAALLSLVLPSNALDTRHSASPQLSRTPSRAVFAMEYLPLDAMQVALTAIAAAHVLNLSVTPSDVTIPYVGLCLVGLALAAGGLLPARHGQRSIFIVALTAIALTAPAGLALQLGTSLTPEILEVLSASSLSLVAACALAIPRSKDSAAGGNGRAGIGRTISATGFGLIGAVVILEVEMINAVQPETWVFVSVACALVWRLMAPARRPASQ